MQRRLGHIAELDGVRGLAALWVFLLHTEMGPAAVTDLRSISLGWRAYILLCSGGSYGVDMFFVLSGFLITSLLILDRESPAYFQNFYWKRVLRIQPVYLLYLLATWFLVPYSHGYVLLALVFLVNFDSRLHVADVGPAWTLAIEEQFYLVWPLVVRRIPVRRVYVVAFAAILFSVLLRSILFAVTGHADSRYTFYRLDGLASGALLACQWVRPDDQPAWLGPWLRALHSRTALWLAVFCAAYLVTPLPAPRLFYPGIALTNFFVYRLIRYVLLHPLSRSLAWLRSRPLRFLGDISYSLYLFHTLLMYAWDRWIGVPQLVFGPVALRLAGLTAASVLVCVAVRHGLELPAQRLRRFVLRRPVLV